MGAAQARPRPVHLPSGCRVPPPVAAARVPGLGLGLHLGRKAEAGTVSPSSSLLHAPPPWLLSPVTWAWWVALGLGLGAISSALGRYGSMSGSSGPEEGDHRNSCTGPAVAGPVSTPPPLSTRALWSCRLLPLARGPTRQSTPPNPASHQEPPGGWDPAPTQLPADGHPGSSALEPGAPGPQHCQRGQKGSLGHRAPSSARAPTSQQQILSG